MARPRSQPATSRPSTDLSKLSSEVLRLRLQQLNLPVTGNHARLVERLRSANGTRQLSATTRTKRADGRVAKRSPTSSKRSKQAARSLNRQSATSNLPSEPQDRDEVLDHFPEEEESATSDLLVDLNAEPMEPMELSDAVFTLALLAAIQDTVSSTVQAAFQSLPHNNLLSCFPALQVLVFLLWCLRTASIVPWTRPSRIKYSAVSTLISLCFCQKHCTRPRPPPSNCVTRTRPQAPWAPRLLLLSARNQL